MKYRRKQPDTFEAIQFTGDNLSEVLAFVDGTLYSVATDSPYRTALVFRTPSSNGMLYRGDWLVRNLETGKMERCGGERFEKEYVEVSETKNERQLNGVEP